MADSHLAGEVKVERPSTPDGPNLQEYVVAFPLDYGIDVKCEEIECYVKYEEMEEKCLGSLTGPLGVTSVASDSAAPLHPKNISCSWDESMVFQSCHQSMKVTSVSASPECAPSVQCSLLQCSHCSVSFDSEINVKEHIALVHTQASPKHLCTLCGKGFDGAHADLYMEIHMLLKHKMMTYKCIICQFSSYETSEIIEHLSKHHSDTGVLDLFKLLSYIARPLCECLIRSFFQYVEYRNPGFFSGNNLKAFNDEASPASAADAALSLGSSSQAESFDFSEYSREIQQIFSNNCFVKSPISVAGSQIANYARSQAAAIPQLINSVGYQSATTPQLLNSTISEAVTGPQIANSIFNLPASARPQVLSSSLSMSHLPPGLAGQTENERNIQSVVLLPTGSAGEQAILTRQPLQSNSLVLLKKTNDDRTGENPVLLVLEAAGKHTVAIQSHVSTIEMQSPVSPIEMQSPVSTFRMQSPVVSTAGMQSPVLSTVRRQSPVVSTITGQRPVVSTITGWSPVVSTITEQSPVSTITEQSPVSTITEQSPVVSTITLQSRVPSSCQAFIGRKFLRGAQVPTNSQSKDSDTSSSAWGEPALHSPGEFRSSPSLSECYNGIKTSPLECAMMEIFDMVTVDEKCVFEIESPIDKSNLELLQCDISETSANTSIPVGDNLVSPMNTIPTCSMSSASPHDFSSVQPKPVLKKTRNPVSDISSGSPSNRVTSVKRQRESSCHDSDKLSRQCRPDDGVQSLPHSISTTDQFLGDSSSPQVERVSSSCGKDSQQSGTVSMDQGIDLPSTPGSSSKQKKFCVTKTVAETLKQSEAYSSDEINSEDDWPSPFVIDDSLFPKSLKIALESQEPTHLHKSSLISALYEQISKYTFYPTRKQYSEVAKVLLEKYPVLANNSTAEKAQTYWKRTITVKFANNRKRRDRCIPAVLDVVSKRRAVQFLNSSKRKRPPSARLLSRKVKIEPANAPSISGPTLARSTPQAPSTSADKSIGPTPARSTLQALYTSADESTGPTPARSTSPAPSTSADASTGPTPARSTPLSPSTSADESTGPTPARSTPQAPSISADESTGPFPARSTPQAPSTSADGSTGPTPARSTSQAPSTSADGSTGPTAARSTPLAPSTSADESTGSSPGYARPSVAIRQPIKQSVPWLSKDITIVGLETKWPSPFVIDERFFPASVRDALEAKEPWSTKQKAITDALFNQIIEYTYYPTSVQYAEVVHALLLKYPCLAANTTMKRAKEFWGMVIGQKFRNNRRRSHRNTDIVKTTVSNYHARKKPPGSRGVASVSKLLFLHYGVKNYLPTRPASENNKSISHHIKFMKIASKSPNRDSETIKKSMDLTFADRRRRIVVENVNVNALLLEYPILFEAEQILNEFTRLTGINIVDRMSKNLQKYGKTIVLMREEARITFPDETTTVLPCFSDCPMSRALLAIPSLFREQIDFFASPTGNGTTQHPHLQLIEETAAGSNNCSQVYAGDIPVCKVSGAVEGFSVWFAAYYVFNFPFCLSVKKTLSFIAQALVGLSVHNRMPLYVEKTIQKVFEMSSPETASVICDDLSD